MNCEHDGSEHLHVHVENAQDIRAVEEVDPEHIIAVSYTFSFPGNITLPSSGNLDQPLQLLQLDPLRRRAEITFNNTDPNLPATIYFADSQAVAQRLQQSAATAGDEGAPVIISPNSSATITVHGTAALWAVSAPAKSTNTNPGLNAPTTPISATGAAASTTTLTVPAGSGLQGRILYGVNYSFSAPTTAVSTLTITDGTTTLTQTVPTGTNQGTFTLPAQGALFASGAAITITLTSGGAAITSTVNAFYGTQNQLVQQIAPTVGVLSERRGAR